MQLSLTESIIKWCISFESNTIKQNWKPTKETTELQIHVQQFQTRIHSHRNHEKINQYMNQFCQYVNQSVNI